MTSDELLDKCRRVRDKLLLDLAPSIQRSMAAVLLAEILQLCASILSGHPKGGNHRPRLMEFKYGGKSSAESEHSRW